MIMDGDLFGKAMKTDPADAATLVIDSGVGGLSVLALARLQMPEENFIFFADAANAPYGDKQPEEIIRLIYDLLRKQAAHPLKAILIACNTATSAAAAELRKELPIPVIGMEPALKPAVLNTEGQVIVMATSLTIREEKFRKLLAQYGEGRDIVPLPCPGLMEIVEKDPLGKDAEDYLRQTLGLYEKTAEALVLGCTHYVFLRPMLRKIFPAIRLFDGNEGVVRHLQDIFRESDRAGGAGRLSLDCSLTAPDAKKAYLDKCARMLSFCESIYIEQSRKR